MASTSVGALWQKNGERGVYFSGTVEIDGKKIGIVVFPNTYKKELKHPDFNILLSRPREEPNAAPLPNEQAEIDIMDIPN